jgi:tetratricopeptide (TPR) repeat protein
VTPSAPAQAFYSVRGIQEMLGLSRGVILGLVDAGFVTPRRGPRNEYRFSFRDVVLLRTAVELRAAQISQRKILAALRQLRASLPTEMPLTGLRITAVGNDVTVKEGGAQWQAESGQRVMDFEVDAATGGVTVLQPVALRRSTPAGRSAQGEEGEEGEEGDAAGWFARAEALETRDPAAAEAAYRSALALEPGFADASLNLGALLCEARRYREAVELYDAAVRLNPGEALLHFNRAIALEDQGRLEAALASYNTSLQLDPDLADAHFNAARLHEQLGDAKKAVRHLSAYRRLQRR